MRCPYCGSVYRRFEAAEQFLDELHRLKRTGGVTS
jgi:transcriptional regulator NrdR family protein